VPVEPLEGAFRARPLRKDRRHCLEDAPDPSFLRFP
jgi:hypothetical protein